jgi:hypothetical protein
MTEDRQFTPAEADVITGVSVKRQQDYEARGLIPPAEPGRWSRQDVEGICRLALIKAFMEVDIPLGAAAEMAERFLEMMGSSLKGVLAEHFGASPYGEQLAAIVKDDQDQLHYSGAHSFGALQMQYERSDGGQSRFNFRNMVVINLSQVARDLADGIKWVEAKRALLARGEAVKARADRILNRDRTG